MAKETKAQRVERIKSEKDGLDVLEDIKNYSLSGDTIDSETIDRLKWYGMYQQRVEDESQLFMLRVKLVGGKITKEQLKVLVDISKKYAKGTANFTTRQDLQFHYISIVDVPAIFELLDSVGLTSRMAAGDCPRNTVTCPVSGVAQDEIIDTTDILNRVNEYFDNNREFSNLPRKFKIGISGCKCHCLPHEIQDISFVAFDNGAEVLFDIAVGGGLSGGKQIAKRLNKACKADQILDVARECAKIFRDHGNRENRTKARVRHIVSDWGVEKFGKLLLDNLGYELIDSDEPIITSKYKRNHIGIHPQIGDKYYIGCSTIAGKVRIEGLEKILSVLESYELDTIVLTTTQDFIILGANESSKYAIAEKLRDIFPPFADKFRSNVVACTGREFCKFAVTETKDFAKELVTRLNSEIPQCPIDVSIHIAGCPNSCSHPQTADIGLIGTKVKDENGNTVEGYSVHLGGYIRGVESEFAKDVKVKVETKDVFLLIKNLVLDYLSLDNGLDFKTFLREKAF
jgi:sulfite reductase (ferredoxin)